MKRCLAIFFSLIVLAVLYGCSPKEPEPVKISECGFIGVWEADYETDIGLIDFVLGIVGTAIEDKTGVNLQKCEYEFFPDGKVKIKIGGGKVKEGTFTINFDGSEAYVVLSSATGKSTEFTYYYHETYISDGEHSLYKENEVVH